MAGLLDMMNSDQGLLGLHLMAAAAPRERRMGFGEGLLSGLQGVQAQRAAEEERKARRQMQEMQMQQQQALLDDRRNAQVAAQAAAARNQQFRGALGAQMQPIGQAEALAAGGGPTNAAAGLVGQQRAPNWQGLAAQFPEQAELLQKLASARDWGAPEVARTVETVGPDGRPVTVQLDKQGRPVGQAMGQWKAPERVDTGSEVQFVDPVTLARLGALGKTMTPGEKASNALGWSNNAISRERLALDREGGGQLVETPEGYVRVGKDNRATAIMAPGAGVRPLMGKGTNMTEDQAKASGWLVQAQNAYGNMLSAIRSDPSAARPGVNDALAQIPGIGAPIANTLRGTDRQKFMQGASSLSEALLRAATGAGINQYEAEQKVAEITPKYGDSDEVVAQKMAAVPLYLESLKLRAGPGASKASAIGAGGANAAPSAAPVLRWNAQTGGFD